MKQLRAWAPLVIGAVLVLIISVLLGQAVTNHIADLESAISKLGHWGILAFVGLFVIGTSLLVPASVFSIAAGALFGLVGGLLAALAGSLASAALQYAISRRLLRARIRRMLTTRPFLASIQRAIAKDDMRLQLLLRLTPLNPATISYLLGAAGVRFPKFLLACLALTPHLFIEVYFGHAGKHLFRMAFGSSQASRVQDMVMIGGLVVGIIVVAIASRVAYKAVLAAVAEGESLR